MAQVAGPNSNVLMDASGGNRAICDVIQAQSGQPQARWSVLRVDWDGQEHDRAGP